MKRPAPASTSDSLFDLPIDQRADPQARRTGIETQTELPLEAPALLPDSRGLPAPRTETETSSVEPAVRGRRETPFRRRLAGGLVDLAAHVAVLGLAVAGSWWLGVPPNRLTFFPLVLFTAGFSFIYHVLPLVFWGHTPGMASRNLIARSLDGGPLTIGQAVRRWLGVLLNVASLGIFFAFGKDRSLSDRLSGSSVHA